MSTLGSLAILLSPPASSAPSSGGDKDAVKTNAAFAGVLDRVTAAKGSADPAAADDDAPLAKGGKSSGDPKRAKDSVDAAGQTNAVEDSALATAPLPVLTDVSALVQAIWLASTKPAAPTAIAEQSAVPQPALTTRGVTLPESNPPGVSPSAPTAAKQEPAQTATAPVLQAGAQQATKLPSAPPPSSAGSAVAANRPVDSTGASNLAAAADAARPANAQPPATVAPATVVPDRQAVPALDPPKPKEAGPIAGTTGMVEPPTLSSLLSSASGGQSDGSGAQNGSDRRSPPTTDGTASTEKTRADDALPVASPAEQVASALRPFLSTESTASAGAVTARAAIDPSAATADQSRPEPLKSLTIQLNPEHLGPVSVTMRLRGSAGMQVSIAAANPQTLHLLDKDRHLLSAVIEAAGGSKDALLIAAAASSPGGGEMGSAGQSPSQSHTGRPDAPASGASSGGGQTRDQGRSNFQTSIPNENDDQPSPQSSQARLYMDDSLYL